MTGKNEYFPAKNMRASFAILTALGYKDRGNLHCTCAGIPQGYKVKFECGDGKLSGTGSKTENKSSKGWSTQHTYVVNRYSHVIIKSALLSVLVIMKECQTSMAYYLIIGLLLTFVLIFS